MADEKQTLKKRGRPKGPEKVTMNIRVLPDTRARIMREACQEGKTYGEIVDNKYLLRD